MAVLPLCVHLPALSGQFRFDPLYVVSGVTDGTWTTNGLIAGRPGWVDANAGVTTEALGALAARDWLHGVVPWWNPYGGVGLPLAAEGQTTAFFLPFGLLLALPHGLLLLRMLLMMLAGVFTLALLRQLGLARLPAMMGSALFQMNGVFAWMAHGPVMPVAFLPMLLLGIEHARWKPAFPWAIVLGSFWSMTAGFPETAVLDGLLAGCWAMLRVVQAADRRRVAARIGGAAALGLALAAPALWPFLQSLPNVFLGEHGRPMAWAFLPANWALLLFPYLFGNIHYATMVLGQEGGIWARAGGYCDIGLVALALLGVRRGGAQAALRRVLLGWVLLFLAKAAGLPMPLLERAMLHVYVLPSWCMALAVLASLALDDWQRGEAEPPWVAMGAGIFMAGAALLAGWPTMAGLWHETAAYRPYPVLSLAGAGVFLTMLAMVWRRPPSRAARIVLAASITGQAAALFALPLLAGTHGRRIDDGSIAWLQHHVGQQRVMSFGPLVPNYGAFFGIAELGYNALPVPRNWVDYVRRHFQPDANGVLLHEGAAPSPARLAALIPAYEAAGVAYVLTWPGEDPFAATGPVRVHTGTAMDIWALPHPALYAEAPGCVVTDVSRSVLQADCAAAAMLLRRELAVPGWQAGIDGLTVPIGVGGEVFQSVALPRGRSDIRFAYAPPGIAWAWATAALALLGCVFWMARARQPRP